MDAIGQSVADAVLGTDTLWGGDVMCSSGTGRFTADSWFSDEPLPPAYKAPAAARVRASGGAASKQVPSRSTFFDRGLFSQSQQNELVAKTSTRFRVEGRARGQKITDGGHELNGAIS